MALSPADALCRLTDAGTDMEGGLNIDRVREMIDWISGIEAHELQYSTLDEAITHIRKLLP